MKVGVALSGGGHRASAWGVGVLAAVVDAGLGRDVTSVTSVSGGSITNGVVAQNVDLTTATPQEFDAGVASALASYATSGLFYPGPRTDGYVRTLFGTAALAGLATLAFVAALSAFGREVNPFWYLALALLVWVIGLALRKPPRLVLVAGAGIGIAAFLGALATSYVDGWVAAAVVLALAVVAAVAWIAAAMLFSRRGLVVARALALTHFHGETTPGGTRLDQVARPVNHVFLATDLESGDQFYLAPRFLYGYREGIADPAGAGTTVATAVQASAALPGAFPPLEVATGKFDRRWEVHPNAPWPLPERVWLSDGGVYDNMAEQWESGFEGRVERWPDLARIQDAAEVLIVANASAAWDWAPFGSPGLLMREVTALLRDQGVQYDVSTSRRRSELLTRFRLAEIQGFGLNGVIVMIDRPPYRVCDRYRNGSGDARDLRAAEALAYLGDDAASRQRWDELVAGNAGAKTTLGPLGAPTTVDLIEHAYVSTLVNLYVLHGLGTLVPFDRARFEALIG